MKVNFVRALVLAEITLTASLCSVFFENKAIGQFNCPRITSVPNTIENDTNQTMYFDVYDDLGLSQSFSVAPNSVSKLTINKRRVNNHRGCHYGRVEFNFVAAPNEPPGRVRLDPNIYYYHFRYTDPSQRRIGLYTN
jgi:hypothetical protein